MLSCEISKNTYFYRTYLVVASVKSKTKSAKEHQIIVRVPVKKDLCKILVRRTLEIILLGSSFFERVFLAVGKKVLLVLRLWVWHFCWKSFLYWNRLKSQSIFFSCVLTLKPLQDVLLFQSENKTVTFILALHDLFQPEKERWKHKLLQYEAKSQQSGFKICQQSWCKGSGTFILKHDF